MPSNYLILCRPLLLPPSIFPSIRVFSNESVLRIRWPKYWSFSFSVSPSNDYSGLVSFRMDWLDLLAVQRTLKSLLQHHSSKASILLCLAFFLVQLSHPYITTGKTIATTAAAAAKSLQSCPTPRDPMDCSLPGSSVHGILQARALEWGAIALSVAMTSWTFVGKVMSFLFNMLSRLVTTFLPRSKRLLISWPQSPSAVTLEPPKIKSLIVLMFLHLFAMK